MRSPRPAPRAVVWTVGEPEHGPGYSGGYWIATGGQVEVRRSTRVVVGCETQPGPFTVLRLARASAEADVRADGLPRYIVDKLHRWMGTVESVAAGTEDAA